MLVIFVQIHQMGTISVMKDELNCLMILKKGAMTESFLHDESLHFLQISLNG